MSVNQEIYLKKIKREKQFVLFFQIFIFFIFLITWEYLSSNNYINSFIYSSPSLILNTLKNLYVTNNLFIHIYTTLFETLFAFILGMLISFLFAIILYNFKIFAKIVDPYLIVLNSLPKIALGPLIIIIFGANTKSVIIMALLITLIVNITTIYTGFLETDKIKLKLLNSFNGSKYQILKILVIPSSYKNIIASLKLNISLSLIGVIMGEFLSSKNGIGYLIIYGSQIFNLNLVMCGIFLLSLISLFLYKLICILENLIIKD